MTSLDWTAVRYVAGADMPFDKGSNWVSAGVVLLEAAMRKPVLINLAYMEVSSALAAALG